MTKIIIRRAYDPNEKNWDICLFPGNDYWTGWRTVRFQLKDHTYQTVEEFLKDHPYLYHYNDIDNDVYFPQFMGSLEDLFRFPGWDRDSLDDESKSLIPTHIAIPAREGVFITSQERAEIDNELD